MRKEVQEEREETLHFTQTILYAKCMLLSREVRLLSYTVRSTGVVYISI